MLLHPSRQQGHRQRVETWDMSCVSHYQLRLTECTNLLGGHVEEAFMSDM